VAELMNVAFQRADLLILTAYLGAKGAAIYAAAEFVTRVIANIRYAFDAIVAGVMAEALQLSDRQRLRYNLQLATRWVVTVASILGGAVIVLRRELLGGLYGPAYVDGAGAVVLLAATHFVSASCGLVSWVLVAGGRSRLILLNNFLGATFNIVASLLLVPRYGFIGGALASLGTMVIVLGSALFEVLVLERVSPFSAGLWKPLAAAAAAFAAESAVHGAVGPAGLRVVAVIAVGLAVAVGMLFATGLPPEERRWVDQLRGRVARSLKR
jgi:O-antigen/teichoic acid export membrane protein